MSEIVKRNKVKNFRKFKHYSELPPELRMMVVDEMGPAERCRFSECSKRSNREAKSSKKYIYSLELYGDEKMIQIQVVHAEYEYMNKIDTGFVLRFEKESEKKYMKYLDWKNDEHWRIELDCATDLHHLAFEYFEKILQFHQNKIKKLKVYHGQFSRNFNVKSLRNLEVLQTDFSSNIIQFLPILRRPLKTLAVHKEDDIQIFKNYEFHQVRYCINLYFLKFDITQYLQLKAKNIKIHIGELKEKDIYDLIKGWQNGNIGKNWEYCQWELKGSKFNSRKLLELLGVFNENPDERVVVCNFKNKEKTKRGALYFVLSNLAFLITEINC